MCCPSHSFGGITLILAFRMVKDWEQQWLKPAHCQCYKRPRKAVVKALILCPESIWHACYPWISAIFFFHTKKKTISINRCVSKDKNNQNKHLITRWRRKKDWLFESWHQVQVNPLFLEGLQRSAWQKGLWWFHYGWILMLYVDYNHWSYISDISAFAADDLVSAGIWMIDGYKHTSK